MTDNEERVYECPQCLGTMIVFDGRQANDCHVCDATGLVKRDIYEIYYGDDDE